MLRIQDCYDASATVVCVDAYHRGVPRGRLYDARQGSAGFGSLLEFLLQMENFLEESGMPQAYTDRRRFAPVERTEGTADCPGRVCRGERATFVLQVRYRRNASWQGQLRWLEGGRTENFRSVLELVGLLDSALRTEEKFPGNRNCNGI